MRKKAARLVASSVLLCVATNLRANTVNLGNVVALGDSITEGKFGLNVPPGLPGGYRDYLQNDLTTLGYTYEFVGQEDNGQSNNTTGYSGNMSDPNNEGYGSFTINDLITGYTLEGHTSPPIGTLLSNDATSANMPAGDTDYSLPSVVLLMIGANDALGGASGSTMASSLSNLVNDIVNDDPTVHLYVASALPVNPNESGFTSQQTLTSIQNYDALIPSAIANYSTSSHPVTFVDNYSTINPYTQTSDGVHPTYQGYQQIAQSWAQSIDEYNRGIQTIVNTSTFTSGVGTGWQYGSIFVNGFDPSPGAGLNGATATFLTDSGSNFPNVFMSVDAGHVYFESTQHLAGLAIGLGGTIQVTPTSTSSKSVLYTWQYFVDNGTLDLTNNAMDVQNGNLTTITSLIQQGYNGGTWTGGGITSSTAADDTTHLTAVGVILNNISGQALYGSGSPLGLFDGVNPSPGDVLVGYTYYGDTNLDGKIDGSDYTRIDNGYLNQLTGWYNGDFNYDGVVNGSDYTLIDNAFNQQGAALNTSFAGPEAAVTYQLAGQLIGTIPTSSVPEPASYAIAPLAMLMLLTRRRLTR